MFILSLLSLLVASGECQDRPPPNPCPDVYSYEVRNDQYYGVITIIPPPRHATVKVEVEQYSSGPADNRGVSLKSQLNIVSWYARRGRREPVQFYVNPARDGRLLPVSSIKINGREFCSAGDAPGSDHWYSSTYSYSTVIGAPTPDGFEFQTPKLIDVPDCGVSPMRPRPFAVFARKSERKEFPWHAAILLKSPGTSGFIYMCGGTLISQKHVITAAHCVTVTLRSRELVDSRKIRIWVGRTSLSVREVGSEEREVSELTVHQHYNPDRFINDIAILKFSESVVYSDYVRPICLWTGTIGVEEIIDRVGYVAGWGNTENGTMSEDLRVVTMPVVRYEDCHASHTSLRATSSSNTFCAGFRNGSSVCTGDSGGGFAIPDNEGGRRPMVWHLRGIVSNGVEENGVCDPEQFVRFTDVAKFLDWIKQTTGL